MRAGRRRTGVLLAAWLFACVAPGPSRGEGSEKADKSKAAGTPTFTTSVDLVMLNVAVRERAYVDGLGPKDFAVYEEGVKQQLAFFSGHGAPLDLTLLIDVSASMAANLPLVRAAAAGLLGALRPGDRASIVGFNQRLEILQPQTSDLRALDAAIRRITADGDTALNTALYVALSELGSASPREEEPRRRALVVFSDGVDTASLVGFDRVLDVARRTGIAIYILQLQRYPESGPEVAAIRFDLKTLARETGGQAYFPQSADVAPGICREIAEELAHQYTLGYVSSLPAATGAGGPKTFRRVTVVVHGRPGARLHTRSGYFRGGTPSPTMASRIRGLISPP